MERRQLPAISVLHPQPDEPLRSRLGTALGRAGGQGRVSDHAHDQIALLIPRLARDLERHGPVADA